MNTNTSTLVRKGSFEMHCDTLAEKSQFFIHLRCIDTSLTRVQPMVAECPVLKIPRERITPTCREVEATRVRRTMDRAENETKRYIRSTLIR